MNASKQMILGFDSGIPLPETPAKSSACPPSPAKTQRAPQATAASRGREFSPADMAIALDRHPDYKVLRRLLPREDWGPVPASGTQRIMVLDTETTGLDPRQESVIELALLSVLVDSTTGLPVGPVTTYEAFEDPGKPIPQAITAITGISDSMVRGQRIDDARVRQLVEATDLVLAHNAGFDRPFVESRWPVFASRPWNCSFVGIDWKAQGSGSAKLEFLAHARGFFYDAHRALIDCHALLQVLAAPLQDGQTGLAHLIAGSTQTRFRLQATGAPFEARDRLKARGYRWDKEQRVWWTSLSGDAELKQESLWLKHQVYDQRPARVQLEQQSSQVQFSTRPGQISELQL